MTERESNDPLEIAGQEPKNAEDWSFDGTAVSRFGASQRPPVGEVTMKSGSSGNAGLTTAPLLELLLKEVVPRLARLACHPDDLSPTQSGSSRRVSPRAPDRESALRYEAIRDEPSAQALELARLCELGQYPRCAAFVADLRRKGCSTEAIFLDLIGPAARLLGEGWVQDRLSFTDVTIGLGVLQQLFASALEDFHTEALSLRGQHTPSLGSGFFCTMPGAQHRLGVQMVRAFFSRVGWRTKLAHASEASELIRQITVMQPDLVCLSISTETEILQAPAFILRVRNACRTFSPTILVGGPALKIFPSLVPALEADLVCDDALDAVARAAECLTEAPLGSR